MCIFGGGGEMIFLNFETSAYYMHALIYSVFSSVFFLCVREEGWVGEMFNFIMLRCCFSRRNGLMSTSMTVQGRTTHQLA